MSSGIICRKCGGNHLTIKCNKDKPEEKKVETNNKKETNTNKSYDNNKQETNSKKSYDNNKQETNFKKSYDNNKQETNFKKSYDNNKQETNTNKSYDNNKKQYDNSNKKHYDNNNNDQYHEKKNVISGKVKMSSLPSDITKEELQELLYDWGHVKYINIKNYHDDTVAYIEFKDEAQANYLIDALDGTAFEYRMLKLCRIE